MKDSLGDRQKSYEDCYRIKLPRRSYTMIRLDGKSFHSYVKGLVRPFDAGLIEDMDATAAYLCKNIMGAKFAYVQSDEISILITDFEDIGTEAWFDNNLQKMVSVAASMATAEFNKLRMIRIAKLSIKGGDVNNLAEHVNNFIYPSLAMFDARVWQIPQKVEVENYIIWRQQDATRNSISSVAQSMYSHKELHGVSSDAKQELIFQKGINWNDYPYRQKRGGIIGKISELWVKPKGAKNAGQRVPEDEIKHVALMMHLHGCNFESNSEYYERNHWGPIETPIFTQETEFLRNLIPDNK